MGKIMKWKKRTGRKRKDADLGGPENVLMG